MILTIPKSIRVGCTGWSIPLSMTSKFPEAPSQLQRYSEVLNCCEINSSFYRSHRHATWRRWADSVPDTFRFSVKLPKVITHERKLEGSSTLISEFVDGVRLLNEKLGPILVQLPPTLKFNERSSKNFFSAFRQRYQGDIVVEPRHVSWFTREAECLLQDFEVARVAADPARAPGAESPGGAESVVYFRLHGAPRIYYSRYSERFITELADRLTGCSTGCPVWCIFDNTASGAACENALQLSSDVLSRIPQCG
jgi:uncharacterized protein YecE (DUF72 family)